MKLNPLPPMLSVSDLKRTMFELRDPDGYWLWFGQNTSDPPTVED